MIGLLEAIGAALALIAGAVLWGLRQRGKGRTEGRQEAEHDAMQDKDERVERGRDALRDGRGAGDPDDRLRRNDGRW